MAETLDFLLEIGTEEMPSAPLMNAAGQLGGLVAKGLDSAGLAHGEVRVISTPRRLAALVREAEAIHREDIAMNRKIGRCGAELLEADLAVLGVHPDRVAVGDVALEQA